MNALARRPCLRVALLTIVCLGGGFAAGRSCGPGVKRWWGGAARPSPSREAAAIAEGIRAGDDACVAAAVELIERSGYPVSTRDNQCVIEALERYPIGTETAEQALIGLLDQKSAGQRCLGIRLLGDSRRAAAAVAGLLLDPDRDVRSAAVIALARMTGEPFAFSNEDTASDVGVAGWLEAVDWWRQAPRGEFPP